MTRTTTTDRMTMISLSAEAAMLVAASTSNRVHAQHILAVGTPTARVVDGAPEAVWEGEGGQLGSIPTPTGKGVRQLTGLIKRT